MKWNLFEQYVVFSVGLIIVKDQWTWITLTYLVGHGWPHWVLVNPNISLCQGGSVKLMKNYFLKFIEVSRCTSYVLF